MTLITLYPEIISKLSITITYPAFNTNVNTLKLMSLTQCNKKLIPLRFIYYH